MIKYFLTVDWCKEGRRGIFCGMDGNAYSKDTPHTQDEIFDILDVFELVLEPQSIPLTEDELKEYHLWLPLAEYSNQYGRAVKSV